MAIGNRQYNEIKISDYLLVIRSTFDRKLMVKILFQSPIELIC